MRTSPRDQFYNNILVSQGAIFSETEGLGKIASSAATSTGPWASRGFRVDGLSRWKIGRRHLARKDRRQAPGIFADRLPERAAILTNPADLNRLVEYQLRTTRRPRAGSNLRSLRIESWPLDFYGNPLPAEGRPRSRATRPGHRDSGEDQHGANVLPCAILLLSLASPEKSCPPRTRSLPREDLEQDVVLPTYLWTRAGRNPRFYFGRATRGRRDASTPPDAGRLTEKRVDKTYRGRPPRERVRPDEPPARDRGRIFTPWDKTDGYDFI